VTSPAAVSVPVILTPGIAEPTHYLDNIHEARVIGQMMYDVINVSLSN
jgi:imidazole glycerol phosphate synthase subunit HisF